MARSTSSAHKINSFTENIAGFCAICAEYSVIKYRFICPTFMYVVYIYTYVYMRCNEKEYTSTNNSSILPELRKESFRLLAVRQCITIHSLYLDTTSLSYAKKCTHFSGKYASQLIFHYGETGINWKTPAGNSRSKGTIYSLRTFAWEALRGNKLS